MRVSAIAQSFPRFPGDSNGPFVKDLCEALSGYGHEMHVAIPYDKQIVPTSNGVLRIHPFRYVWPDSAHVLGYSRTLRRDMRLRIGGYLLSPLYLRYAERVLCALIRRHEIDLVHAHWLLPNGYAAFRAARKTGTPYLVTLHGSDVYMAERNPLFRKMAQQTVNCANYVTSCSPDLTSRLRRVCNADRDNTLIDIPYGTNPTAENPELRDTLRERFHLNPELRYVMGIGRMVDKKGFKYLIEAMQNVMQTDPKVRLLLGGGGDLLNHHRQYARQLGIMDKTIFTDSLTHDEVTQLISFAELFVMPSVRDARGNVDGMPLVILEAMAAGKPVIASELAGIPDVVTDGETGLLVAPNDAARLSNAILSLLDNPELSGEMGRRARDRIETELSWHQIAGRYDALYHQAVGVTCRRNQSR